MAKMGTMPKAPKSAHDGLYGDCPKAPSGYGVKKMANKKDTERKGTAPTPKTLGGRSNG